MIHSQREDGREEAQAQVKEALLHMRYIEQGLSWKVARDYARADMHQQRLAQEVADLAARQVRRQTKAHERL